MSDGEHLVLRFEEALDVDICEDCLNAKRQKKGAKRDGQPSVGSGYVDQRTIRHFHPHHHTEFIEDIR